MIYFLDQFRNYFSNFEWKFAILIPLIRSIFCALNMNFVSPDLVHLWRRLSD